MIRGVEVAAGRLLLSDFCGDPAARSMTRSRRRPTIDSPLACKSLLHWGVRRSTVEVEDCRLSAYRLPGSSYTYAVPSFSIHRWSPAPTSRPRLTRGAAAKSEGPVTAAGPAHTARRRTQRLGAVRVSSRSMRP
jgi:hypothetical protein